MDDRESVPPEEPQVSWKAIERNAAVRSSDGEELGKVVEVAGDPDADIFNGLVVSLGFLGANRYVAAERVTGIWPHVVQVSATAAELERAPEYEEPVAERWAAPDDFMTRLRRFFGFYGRRDRD
ncbi:MAG TPA: PRC-barrel domain-containing protein [Gaiellaceae bacterium]|nr:PRC-barrel domain-containing protein [Gaiellaceae bacterium]